MWQPRMGSAPPSPTTRLGGLGWGAFEEAPSEFWAGGFWLDFLTLFSGFGYASNVALALVPAALMDVN